MKILETLQRRSATPSALHPDAWPDSRGRARVLVEDPDGAGRWAHAETLRDAGYDAVVCPGPTGVHKHERPGYFEDPQPSERGVPRSTCPILTGGRCPLAEEADVIVTTASLTDGPAIVAAHERRGAVVVFEDRPVSGQQLLDAVESALT